MAEKYGTVPKKFTKAWWSWYWMYYKWHTIGVIFVLLLVGLTVFDKLTAEKFDITLTYAGKTYYSDSQKENVEKAFSPLCDDLDGNGKKSLLFTNIDINFDSKDAEYMQANSLKLQMAIGEDKTYLFILDKEVADIYIGETPDEAAFTPLKDWVTADISGLDTYSAHGNDYGIDISNLNFFKDLGIDTTGKYMFIRYYPRKDQIKEHLKGYKASIDLANRIISGN